MGTKRFVKSLPQDAWSVGEVALTYKRRGKTTARYQVKSSESAKTFIMERWDDLGTIQIQEKMFALFLNKANRAIGFSKISEGGVSGTVMDVKTIGALALLRMASAVILFHNHPSGNINPSEADIKITANVKAGLKLLDISLLDHIIVTPEDEGYFSFADEGIL